MADRKLKIDELACLNDGTTVDIAVINNKGDNSENLLKDEINEFIGRQKMKKVSDNKTSTIFSTVPKSELKSAIERIIKTNNTKDEIMKKQAQFDFDAKMARIRKIKSKTYRKMRRRDKLRKLEGINIEESEDVTDEDDNLESFRPIIDFGRKDDAEIAERDMQQKIVAEAFESSDKEEDFLKEKSEIIKSEAPQTLETVLPGWGDWAGEGIETIMTKFNTITEHKEGIKIKDRQDFLKSNVIVNEKTVVPDKYLSKLPYGYTYNSYKSKIATPISMETTSLRVFNKFVKMSKKDDLPFGKNIEPSEFNPEY